MSINPTLSAGVVVTGNRDEAVNVLVSNVEVIVELKGGRHNEGHRSHIGFVGLCVDDARLLAMALTRAANQIERKGGG